MKRNQSTAPVVPEAHPVKVLAGSFNLTPSTKDADQRFVYARRPDPG